MGGSEPISDTYISAQESSCQSNGFMEVGQQVHVLCRRTVPETCGELQSNYEVCEVCEVCSCIIMTTHWLVDLLVVNERGCDVRLSIPLISLAFT